MAVKTGYPGKINNRLLVFNATFNTISVTNISGAYPGEGGGTLGAPLNLEKI